jgi:hypothetical protein
MKISRTTVLLLSTAVVTITSIGMSSFSLFLRPMEADFGWSRSMVTLPYMFAMLGGVPARFCSASSLTTTARDG